MKFREIQRTDWKRLGPPQNIRWGRPRDDQIRCLWDFLQIRWRERLQNVLETNACRLESKYYNGLL